MSTKQSSSQATKVTGKRSYHLGAAALVAVFSTAGQTAEPLDLNETSIAQIRAAILSGKTTCQSIVSAYIERIKTLDSIGTKPLLSIIAINPRALQEAKQVDERRGVDAGPLLCAPLIIKDNIDVQGMPTTAGSNALKTSLPVADATQVSRLRAAGAIVLAKSNLAEFAWTPDYSESSRGGLTRNPYDLDRTPGGSSGGTAAAVAANFGVAGLGTDTGASIRGPSALQNLVGLRPTMGASSRAGVVPITLTRDTVGPMTRNVADAAAIFEVTSGFDRKDAATYAARQEPTFNAKAALSQSSLQGMRLGVLRQMSNRDGADKEVASRFERAIETLRERGALVVDVNIADLDKLKDMPWPTRMEYDFNAYLAGLGKDKPISSFRQLVESGQFIKEVRPFLENESNRPHPSISASEEADAKSTKALREALIRVMDRENLSAFVYPTWNQPPRLLTALTGDGGNNNPMSAHAGLPAITVPMGSTSGNLPTSLQFTGRPFSEMILVGAAYDFEQATHHRIAPTLFPAARLDGNSPR